MELDTLFKKLNYGIPIIKFLQSNYPICANLLYCLFLFCNTKISEISDMKKS